MILDTNAAQVSTQMYSAASTRFLLWSHPPEDGNKEIEQQYFCDEQIHA